MASREESRCTVVIGQTRRVVDAARSARLVTSSRMNACPLKRAVNVGQLFLLFAWLAERLQVLDDKRRPTRAACRSSDFIPLKVV